MDDKKEDNADKANQKSISDKQEQGHLGEECKMEAQVNIDVRDKKGEKTGKKESA